jgi:type IV pilus biogenesis protein CpaD/CtpE
LTRFIELKILLFLGIPFFSGCLSASPAAISPRPWTGNQVLSKTYTEDFSLLANRKTMVSKTGKDFDEFLRDTIISAPGLVVFRLKKYNEDAARIWTSISASGIQEVSKVLVQQTPSTNERTPALTLELTYFAYKLADCGGIANLRKIDSTSLTSPGFGCSVERNRMLSLSYPPDWQQGRQTSPPFAIQDGQAVKSLYEKPPRSFPPVNK